MKIIDDLDRLVPVTRLAAHEPETPFVVGSPHSGCDYPFSFVESSRLSRIMIRRSEDAYVDGLVSGCTQHGMALIKANFPRAYCDVNREPFELDPLLIKGPLPHFANASSLRVASGLGTIARVVGERQDIYRTRISLQEALMRIERFYRPYHAALRRELADRHVRFGATALIDCHSMPSRSRGSEGFAGPDFIIGDRYGTSAAPELAQVIVDTLSGAGYRVARNKPFAGGFITEHYGRPQRGIHAVQIEINRALYMEEACLTPHDGFARIAQVMSMLFEKLASFSIACLLPDRKLAAE